MTQPIPLAALVATPAAGFDSPFEMLQACHERIERTLGLLESLRAHHALHGPDAQARQAAADVLRYFDLAAPHHHQDEELHVFPALVASGDAAMLALVARLKQDHLQMEAGWRAARTVLAGIAEGGSTRLTPPEDAALAAFAALYGSHIEAEEQVAYPQARTSLSAPALAAMGRDMRRRRGAV